MSRLAGVAFFIVFATLYVRSFAIPWRSASRLATGHAAVAAATNVLGGEKAPRGRLPYLCHMRYTIPIGRGTCTGFLVTPNWILTAAHCVDDSEGERIIDEISCGVQNIVDPPEKNMFQAADIHIHELYDPPVSQLRYDIALIKLDRKVDSPIPILAAEGAPEEDSPAYIAGWGEFDNSGETSDDLRFAETFVVNNDECYDSWIETYPTFVLEEDRLCAGESNGRTCYGDSGGPLISLNSTEGSFESGDPEADVIVGITSFGVCDGELPAVFTSMHFYADWVGEMLKTPSKKTPSKNKRRNKLRRRP